MATTDQDNEAVVRQFFDAWNEADLDVVDDVVAADAEQHNPQEPPVPPGPEGEKQLIEVYHSAFSNATLTIEEIVADGDSVAVRYTATGTHDGEFMGVEPTGNDVEIVGFEINRLAEGQIVESWGLFDTFGLMQQLGVVDPPGE